MGIIKYNPTRFSPLGFGSLFDKLFDDEFFGNSSAPGFSPGMDVTEDDKSFGVEFHLPGIKKEEIKIDLNNGRLTVSGERKLKNEKNLRNVESYYGTFSRSIQLPDSIDEDNISASYENGVLGVVIPKDEKKAAQRTIAIR